MWQAAFSGGQIIQSVIAMRKLQECNILLAWPYAEADREASNQPQGGCLTTSAYCAAVCCVSWSGLGLCSYMTQLGCDTDLTAPSSCSYSLLPVPCLQMLQIHMMTSS